jgi:hypothetical protein
VQCRTLLPAILRELAGLDASIDAHAVTMR